MSRMMVAVHNSQWVTELVIQISEKDEKLPNDWSNCHVVHGLSLEYVFF